MVEGVTHISNYRRARAIKLASAGKLRNLENGIAHNRSFTDKFYLFCFGVYLSLMCFICARTLAACHEVTIAIASFSDWFNDRDRYSSSELTTTIAPNLSESIVLVDSFGNVCNQLNKRGSLSGLLGANLSEESRGNFTDGDMRGKKYRFLFNPGESEESKQIFLCVRQCLTTESNITTVNEFQKFAKKVNSQYCRYDIPISEYNDSDLYVDSEDDYQTNDYEITKNKIRCPALPRSPEIAVLDHCVTKLTEGGFLMLGAANLSNAKTSAPAINRTCAPGLQWTTQLGFDIKRAYDERYMTVLTAFSFGVSLVFFFGLMFIPEIFVPLLFVADLLAPLAFTGFCALKFVQVTNRTTESIAENLGDSSVLDPYWHQLVIFGLILTAISLILLLPLVGSIIKCIYLCQEVRSYVLAIPGLPVQPILTAVFVILFLAGYFVILVCMQTVDLFSRQNNGGELTDASIYMLYPISTKKLKSIIVPITAGILGCFQALQWFYVFGIILMIKFIFVCERYIISFSFSSRYFRRQGVKTYYLDCVVLWGNYYLILHHIGTAACGSLLIEITLLPAVICSFVYAGVKAIGGAGGLADACRCCIGCHVSYLQFIDEDAFIVSAIYGTDFMTSAIRAQALKVNVSVTDAKKFMSARRLMKLTIFIANTAIALAQMGVGYWLLEVKYNDKELCQYWTVLSITSFISFCLSHSFLVFHQQAIDTLFICYCEDVCRNNGTTSKYFMSKKLTIFLEEYKRRQHAGNLEITGAVVGFGNNRA